MLTSNQIRLIEDSWYFIILNTEQTGAIFYNHLFEKAPELKEYFKEDIKAQSRKFIALVSFVVHKLRSLDEITEEVKELGVRHEMYKVKVADYSVVREALLWTLERTLGNKWDTSTKDAWIHLYDYLTDTMVNAAHNISEKQPAFS